MGIIEDLQSYAQRFGTLFGTGCYDLNNTSLSNQIADSLKQNLADLGSAEVTTLKFCFPEDLELEAQVHWEHSIGDFLPHIKETYSILSHGNPIQAQICVDYPSGFGRGCVSLAEIIEAVIAIA